MNPIFEKIELEPNEEVLALVRKHWFVIFLELIGTIILILTPLFIIIIIALLPKTPEAILIVEDHLRLLAYSLTIWLIMSTLAAFTIWTYYYLDIWLITDRRIVVVDQVHFFNRKVSSFRLERLQDVKAVINGMLATFLNFGTLHVHTAGNTEENFTTSGLPDPRRIQALIQKATDTRLQTIGRAHLLEP
jgi:Bacterial PH domain